MGEETEWEEELPLEVSSASMHFPMRIAQSWPPNEEKPAWTGYRCAHIALQPRAASLEGMCGILHCNRVISFDS